MDYSQHVSTRTTPQSEPIPGTAQVPNSAGGFTWAVDDWTRLDRFLILGSEGPTYYASEKKLTKENAAAVTRCIQTDGPRAVRRIVEVSTAGRAPKNDPAIFALALAAALGDSATKAVAFEAMPKVCRIGTHLFHFAQAVQAFRGWGRGLRRAVQGWYSAEIDHVVYQAIKYRQRDGWTHADLLRLAHVTPPSAEHQALFRWLTGSKDLRAEEQRTKKGVRLAPYRRFLEPVAPHPLVAALDEITAGLDVKRLCALIREHDLPREVVPPEMLNQADVWAALLERMPMTAMVRSLAKMTAVGLLAPMSEAVAHVVRELGNEERIRRSRLHPIALLSAQRVYAQGHGERGSLTWAPVSQIIDALDAAFYTAFENVPITGKRYVLALDVSGSMGGGAIAGVPGLTPRDASAALALVTAAREPNHVIMGFATEFRPLPISPKQRLADAVRVVSSLPFGGTDCSLPMLWALEQKLAADGFVVLTDSETWAGAMHPSQALTKYRRETGISAKLAVVAMVSNGFTIADPNDAGMLDVVGMDTTTPSLIADFIGSRM
jgi:60 kDa SS-A/Ro ribonucleoprotein